MRVKIIPAARKHAYSLSVFTKTFFPYAAHDVKTIEARLENKNHEYWVASREGHSIGFAHVEFKPRARQAKVLGFAVLPEFRGRGVGEKLLRKVLARAKARGCTRAVLLVLENNVGAQRLYEKFGFTRSGVLAKQLCGEKIFLYSRELKKKRIAGGGISRNRFEPPFSGL